MNKIHINNIYSKVFHSAVVAIGVTDTKGNYLNVNPAWCDYTGYTETEALKLNVADLTPSEDKSQSNHIYKKLIGGDVSTLRKTRRYLRKDGSIFWADLHVSSITDEENNIIGVIGVFVDIDRRVKAENQQKELNRVLTKLARHDSLTGLFNRRALEEILMKELKRAIRYKRGFAVALADVDDFKKVNDTYGHDCGDIVLRHLANIFQAGIRDTDYVGRWGGEEFLFIFTETTCEGAQIVAERIRHQVNDRTLGCNGHELSLSVTIGFSYQHGQTSITSIIAEADKALYQGKTSGKNRVVCFQENCDNA
jgi:diguanylate cyclase (GGDEF)-like protein/PAS domain S-box-containing protein